MPSKCTLLTACALTLVATSLHAGIFRFWNHTFHAYSLDLAMVIETFDITDHFVVEAHEYTDREYDQSALRFMRLVLEDDTGKRRYIRRPFADVLSHGSRFVMHIYEDRFEMRAM